MPTEPAQLHTPGGTVEIIERHDIDITETDDLARIVERARVEGGYLHIEIRRADGT